jgi:hypothetical protein
MNPVATLEQKQYERLERHVRASATVRELAHWDSIRIESRLAKERDNALRDAIADRLRALTGGRKP